MRTYQDYNQFNVWDIHAPVKVECARATMYFAPEQGWTEDAKRELESDSVFLKGNMAVRRFGGRYVLGYEDDGCISFVKNGPGIMPKYHREYGRQDIENFMEILMNIIS